MNLIKKLKLLFSYNSELEILLQKIKEEKIESERERTKDYLNLCAKHQQRNSSIYSEKNCDYCKLLNAYQKLCENNNSL